ncbi:hypothetical protein CRYUN_Cryun03dG0091000 [Craigia yunnanensis]
MASTKVQRIMTQPINLIFRFLQSKARIQIWLFEQKDLKIEGRIIGFDEYMNLVLDDAEEFNIKKKSRKSLGRILLKGDNITLMMNSMFPVGKNYDDMNISGRALKLRREGDSGRVPALLGCVLSLGLLRERLGKMMSVSYFFRSKAYGNDHITVYFFYERMGSGEKREREFDKSFAETIFHKLDHLLKGPGNVYHVACKI